MYIKLLPLDTYIFSLQFVGRPVPIEEGLKGRYYPFSIY